VAQCPRVSNIRRVTTDDVRRLLSPGLYHVLLLDIAADLRASVELADRIATQTLVFLMTQGQSPHERLTPCADVAEGWARLARHTQPYQALCDRVARRHLDHVPHLGQPDPVRVNRTVVKAIHLGLPVDRSLWEGRATLLTSSVLNAGEQ
jgi:hypothetical protein